MRRQVSLRQLDAIISHGGTVSWQISHIPMFNNYYFNLRSSAFYLLQSIICLLQRPAQALARPVDTTRARRTHSVIPHAANYRALASPFFV